MKKLFISCPMRKRSEEDIRKTFDKLHRIAEAVFDKELEVIPTYFEGNPPANVNEALWYLGESIKKLSEADYFIGIFDEAREFRGCIMHINAVFLVLQQLGVGPEKGFDIVDASAVWDDFLPGDERAKAIASYMGAKVRLAFDPPQSSTAMEALKNTVAEMEFRLNIEFDKTEA